MGKQKNTERYPTVEKIIKIQNGKRLSQGNFGELIGIDYTTYNKIESRYLKLSLENLSKIAINVQMSKIDIFSYPKNTAKF